MKKLQISDLELFEEVLAEAFINDPLFIELSKNVQKRKKYIIEITRMGIEVGSEQVEIYATSDKHEGIAIWVDTSKKRK